LPVRHIAPPAALLALVETVPGEDLDCAAKSAEDLTWPPQGGTSVPRRISSDGRSGKRLWPRWVASCRSYRRGDNRHSRQFRTPTYLAIDPGSIRWC